MSETAERTDPKLWEIVKQDVTAGDKGGDKGQWSARKAQLAVSEYRKRGGGYVGDRSDDNSLSEWTREDWGTKSGAMSLDSGERYLPKSARDALSDDEYRRTTAKKRADRARGRQFSSQPRDVAEKVAGHRDGGTAGMTKAELMELARKLDVRGRSRMTRDELAAAVAKAERGPAASGR